MSESTSGPWAPDQPELNFFIDPAIDRLLGVVFNLATELQATRDRLQRLEAVLVERQGLPAEAVEQFEPGPALQARLEADRRDYVRHLLEPMLGRAASRSMTGGHHAG